MNQSLNQYEYQSQLSRDVMRRVWMVFFVKRTLGSETFKIVIFMSCCVTAVFMVSIPNVIQNLSNVPGIAAEAAYLMGAFLNTSVVVEGAVVVAMAAGGWLMWDIGRNVKSSYFVRGMRMRDRSGA
ncbi:MAG: hypothetical protein JWO00_214 [Candidatus Parcubacteria bacterium]|nr:hypothetical protein [Candidatus Parcubacteria bacterium]